MSTFGRAGKYDAHLTADQLKRYLETLDKEEDQNAAAFLRFALSTGMQKCALLNLHWSDIDFEMGFITLRGDASKKGKKERIPRTGGTKNPH